MSRLSAVLSLLSHQTVGVPSIHDEMAYQIQFIIQSRLAVGDFWEFTYTACEFACTQCNITCSQHVTLHAANVNLEGVHVNLQVL